MKKHFPRRSMLFFCSLFLTSLLASCGNPATASTSITATPTQSIDVTATSQSATAAAIFSKATSTATSQDATATITSQNTNATATATSNNLHATATAVVNANATAAAAASANPTPAPNTANTSGGTFKGNGFSITYPQGWSESGSNGIALFTSVNDGAVLMVESIANPNGAASSSAALQTGLNGASGALKNTHKKNVASTVSVGGATWNQGAITGDVTQSGQTLNMTMFVLTTNYPAHSKSTRIYMIIYSSPTSVFDQDNANDFQPMLQSFTFH